MGSRWPRQTPNVRPSREFLGTLPSRTLGSGTSPLIVSKSQLSRFSVFRRFHPYPSRVATPAPSSVAVAGSGIAPGDGGGEGGGGEGGGGEGGGGEGGGGSGVTLTS